LIAPVVLTIAAILGYPLYQLARLSFQKYGLFELIAHHGTSVGWANYSSVLHDHVFWHVLLRTIVFTVANVALAMGIGTLLALLLTKVSSLVRVLLTAALVLAWAMPPVVAVQVWIWMTNPENGVLNYTLTKLHVGDYSQHDWLGSSFSQLSVTTSLMVWGAIPFIVVTVYAGLSQVPHELVEAAEIDGARAWRVFLDVTLPILKPIFLILTSLSIIWDFGVFTQPFLLIGQASINTTNELMGIYLYEEGYVKTDYARGAAISILMLLIVAILSIVYVRKMVKTGDETA
jgi:N,N'-diacetylchitobiose transport system permease protein